MKYRILCVGRRARDPLLEAAEDYTDRLSHYTKTDVVRIRESKKDEEGKKILQRVDPSDFVVALDERGQTTTTRKLAQRLSNFQREGRKQITWVLGGPDGLSAEVSSRAQLILSLSALTLPHRLALVILLEQLYRAHTILRGEPYHRD